MVIRQGYLLTVLCTFFCFAAIPAKSNSLSLDSIPVEAIIEVDRTTICVGNCLEIFNSSTGDPTFVEWSLFGIKAQGGNLFQCFNDEGTYEVGLYVENDCSSDSTSVSISVNDTASGSNLGEIEICDGSPFVSNGEVYDRPGIYLQTILKPDGCDSMILFTLVECLGCDFNTLVSSSTIKFKKVSDETVDISLDDSFMGNYPIGEVLPDLILALYPSGDLDNMFYQEVFNQKPYVRDYLESEIQNSQTKNSSKRQTNSAKAGINSINQEQLKKKAIQELQMEFEDLRVGSSTHYLLDLRQP